MLVHSVLKSNQIAQHVIADVVAKAARAANPNVGKMNGGKILRVKLTNEKVNKVTNH